MADWSHVGESSGTPRSSWSRRFGIRSAFRSAGLGIGLLRVGNRSGRHSVSQRNESRNSCNSDPILMCPDHDRPFTLEVDASQYALGAVLSQRNNASRLQPVGYFSKTLIPAERNYDVYDRELLTLVQSLKHWRHLLMGTSHPIEVFTNHEGLTKYRQPQKIG